MAERDARRPVLQITAFGAPVDPEVKVSSSVVDGSLASGMSGRSTSAAASSASAHRGPSIVRTRSASTPVSRPSSSAAWSESVTMRSQSTPRMSAASSAPRRVGLIPTIVAPASAPAPIRKM